MRTSSEGPLHSPPLRRTAAVVRHRRYVADGTDLDTRGGQRADGRLAARTGARHAHIDGAQTVIASCVGGILRRLLRRERRALARATEAKRTRRLPAERVALLVRDGDDGVVEARLNEHEPERNILAFPLLELLVLAGLGAGCRSLGSHGLFRRFLLGGNRALARAFAGAGVGVGALAADRQRAAMAQAAIALDLDQALDVQADVLAQVALDLPLGLDDVADAVQRILVERANLRVGIDIRFGENLRRARVADPKDVRESDAYLLVVRYVDSGNTCHGNPFRCGPVSACGLRTGLSVCGYEQIALLIPPGSSQALISANSPSGAGVAVVRLGFS